MVTLEGLTKHISLYRERWLTELGYSAASVLQALHQISKLLTETLWSNLLIESCKLYVNCELFITALHLLVVLTYKVTLPFQKSTQNELLKNCPKLHWDLLNHDMDTHHDFQNT